MRLLGGAPLVALAISGALLHSHAAPARPLARAHLASATSAHLQVTQVEYRLLLSSGTVKAGPVDLQAIDRGVESHDLRLRRNGSQQETAVPRLLPGHRWAGIVNLRAGTYYLWCSLPEHAKLGMHTTLTVVN